MYAVIDLTGKQRRIEKNEIIRIEKIDKNNGNTIEFDKLWC